MKKKYYIIIGLAVALIIAWFFLPRQRLEKSVPAVTESQKETSPTSSPAPHAEDLAKTPLSGPPAEVIKRIEQVRGAMNDANQPISFYGTVIDQDGAPLPGVKVTLGVRRTSELLPGITTDNSDRFALTTDQAGRFQLINEKGALLSVKSLEKAGYEASRQSMRYYWYYENEDKKFRPDANSPETFLMWKLAGAETLLRKSIGVGIPYDGSTVIFDIQSGREVKSGGDVKVTLLRTPLQIKRGQEKYDWTATIEAVNGGVIASTDEFMYRAPESGYESKITITTSAKDAKWSASKSVSFYLKSRGTYARVTADFTTDYDKPKTGFRITAFINQSGSRNLEYDPLQGVAKP
jgi:hypothetical protein